jgi:hypothetical protein
MHTVLPYKRNPLTLERNALMGFGSFAGLRGLGQALVSDGVQLASAAVNTWLNQINLAHDADTATTQIVNGLAPLLQANVNAYLSGPGTCADQAAAISAYLTAVQWLMSSAGCGNGAYGSAGNRCISNRFGPGGATDTTNPNNVSPFYPWASYYYTPIASDQRAATCAAQVASDDPNAAEQSAIQNISNLTSGSDVQTTAGQFDTTAVNGTASATAATSTVTVGSTAIPTSYLILGAAAIVALIVLA